jgi:hypothetical protein
MGFKRVDYYLTIFELVNFGGIKAKFKKIFVRMAQFYKRRAEMKLPKLWRVPMRMALLMQNKGLVIGEIIMELPSAEGRECNG